MLELTKILSSFSENEMKRFDDFVHSPYHNKSRRLVSFFDELKMGYPFKEDYVEDLENIYSKVFEKEYNPSTARDLPSVLMRLTEDFFAVENFYSVEMKVTNHLLANLIKTGNGTLLEKNLVKIKEKIEDEEKLSSIYLLERFRYEINKFNGQYFNEGISKKSSVSERLGIMENSIIHITSYYITEIVSIYVNLLMYDRNYATDKESNLALHVMESIDHNKLKNVLIRNDNCSAITELYYLLLDMFTNIEDTEKYMNYKNKLITNLSRLSSEEAFEHFVNLIRYSLLKLNDSNDSQLFRKELLNLYEIILEEKIYQSKKSNFIPLVLFRDILLNGLRLKNFEWTANFIETYICRLSPDLRKQMENFCYMYLYYESGDNTKAIEFSSHLLFEHFIYKLDVRNVLVRIYYELGNAEAALDQIYGYAKFLKRDKLLSTARKERYINFIKYLRWIILFKEGRSKLESGYIREKINGTQNIAFKQYLNEKIDEIEQGRQMAG